MPSFVESSYDERAVVFKSQLHRCASSALTGLRGAIGNRKEPWCVRHSAKDSPMSRHLERNQTLSFRCCLCRNALSVEMKR